MRETLSALKRLERRLLAAVCGYVESKVRKFPLGIDPVFDKDANIPTCLTGHLDAGGYGQLHTHLVQGIMIFMKLPD